ncbi:MULTISPECIES: enoyl-CoA hydratase/isomerase family protein [Streptomyces]|uniref:Enoyl-CoA hydratase n=1 Tax=Streptomyces parvulus TaxID=146923 RepID=A0A191VAK7_9ACTN|nr:MULTISPECIES: enoyl-CoA hydratase/isomerase family protein [Streptomyces]ANJ12061.1 enoyl-CoA hydratase [Streptomyces parvulus]MZD56054.1 enoyl-CoA hydratase/isomerase family protein [Streptomyces sp. SID5606]GGS05410.1 enoyl-CoA hydratase [Streptomyces parvulus]
MTDISPFRVVQRSASYWRVTFDSPPINLVTFETFAALGDLLDRMDADDDLKVVVFDSADPDFFLAHFDLVPPEQPYTGPTWLDVAARMARSRVITIASVRGRARGVGNEFLLACDMRFASRERAVLGQPEVGAGITPGGGAPERLPLLVGRGRALEIIAGADDFDAETAERYGWINRALPDAELDAHVDRIATRIASFDRRPLAEVKALVNRSTLPSESDLKAGQDTFRASLAWPEAHARISQLLQRGMQQRNDVEYRLGDHIAER